MSDKMQVLFAKQTGHVLAAFTRTVDPETKLKVADVTGGGLPVRQSRRFTLATPPIEIILPPEVLDLSVVDFDSAVFGSPREYVVGGGGIAQLGPGTINLASNTELPPTSASGPPVSDPPRVKFNTTRVTVQIVTDTAEDQGVCIVLEESAPLPGVAPERRVAQGQIGAGTHFISLDWKTGPDGSPVSIPPGNFKIMVMLAGYQPLFGSITAV